MEWSCSSCPWGIYMHRNGWYVSFEEERRGVCRLNGTEFRVGYKDDGDVYLTAYGLDRGVNFQSCFC